MNQRIINTAIFSFISLVGIMMIVTSLCGICDSYILDKKGISMRGLVSKIEYLSNAEFESLRFQIKFIYKNNSYIIYNKYGGMASTYQLNENINVRFMSNAPNEAVIDNKREKYDVHFMLLIIGVMIAAVGPAALFIKRFLRSQKIVQH